MVSTLNRGEESTRRRASVGGLRWPGGASVHLHPSVGGQHTTARREMRRRFGRPEEEGGHRVGQMPVGPARRENNKESGLGCKDD
jgi:hypothetical protein